MSYRQAITSPIFGGPDSSLYMETCPPLTPAAYVTHRQCFLPSSHFATTPPAVPTNAGSDSASITEPLKFDGFTFLIPKLEHITNPPEAKDHCLSQTIQAIAISGAPSQTKYLALSSRFQHLPLAVARAQCHLVGLNQLGTPGIFHFTNTKVLDANGQVVQLYQDPAAQDQLRVQCRYLMFDWHMRPQHINPHCTGPPRTLNVALELPTTPNGYMGNLLLLTDAGEYLRNNDTVTPTQFFCLRV